jgi:hypothetical protein
MGRPRCVAVVVAASLDLTALGNPCIRQGMTEPRHTIFLDLDQDAIAKRMRRFRVTMTDFTKAPREDGRIVADFLLTGVENLDQVRLSLFAMKEMLWADFFPVPGGFRVEMTGKTRNFEPAAVVAAMRKLKLEFSKSSSTAVRGYRTSSNGYRVSGTYDAGMKYVVNVSYLSRRPDDCVAKDDELVPLLIGAGFVVERVQHGVRVLGFSA